MNKKVLIAIIAVIGIVVVGGAIATMSAVDHTVNDSRGECKYTVTEVDSYTYTIGSSSFVDVPAEGKKFIRVTGTLTNNQDTWTITNNPFNFRLSADGLLYNYDNENYDTVEITKGSTANIDLCFEVPSTASDLKLEWNGGGNITMTKQ